MKLEQLKIDGRVIEILKEQGIEEFYPPQEASIGYAMDDENLVLSAPTAGGKSLVAYLAMLKSVLNGGKAMYIVPLRALASEKYEDLKIFEKIGVKIAVSYGDLDSPEPELESFDIIIVTSEKADSLLRHRAYWLKKITIVVADEIHLINDPGRGPTFETILSRFKENAQIIGLSATIKNSEELAEWLNARHVKSDWRPVPLKEGVYLDGAINFIDNTAKKIKKEKDEIVSLVSDTLKDNGQTLIFTNTRRSAEGLAEKLSETCKKFLDEKEKSELKKVSEKIIKSQSEPTSVGSRIAKCVENGAAYHHAGLSNTQRKTIEKNFRNGEIKCIAATPTLAAGINLPARRVIIKNLYRFDPNFGRMPIPILEIKQMEGRAGRPQYDKEGEAILIAKNEDEKNRIYEDYLLGETESIYSKLGSENALRTHILSSIASGFVNNEEMLKNFIGNTFYACQTDIWKLDEIIEKVVGFLEENSMIKGFNATKYGKKVSDLYIDPLSAVKMKEMLEKNVSSDFSLLHAVCATPDMPVLYLRKNDYEWVEEKANKNKELIINEDYEYFLSEVKTACLLEDWTNEFSEEHIINRYGVGPGDIYAKTETGEWLLYSMRELAGLFNRGIMRTLNRLMRRMKYGVKEELLELTSLKGIGRIRARVLFKNGLKTIDDLRKVDAEKLSRIKKIGKAVAEDIKRQVDYDRNHWR